MNEITRKNYHTDTTRISKSGLDLINRSPLHYLHRYKTGQRERKRHFDIGTGAHTFILEPERIDEELAIVPDYAPKRPTASQLKAKHPSDKAKKSIEFWGHFDREHAEKAFIFPRDLTDIHAMRASVFSHPAAAELLREGVAEHIHTWTDPTTGVDMKMRADWIVPKRKMIVDLKTTDDASPKAFARSARKWRYDVQAAVYLDGINYDNFIFIAVEKKPPYAVGVYFATPEMINEGRDKRDANLNTYAECLSNGIFRGYSDIIEPMAW